MKEKANQLIEESSKSYYSHEAFVVHLRRERKRREESKEWGDQIRRGQRTELAVPTALRAVLTFSLSLSLFLLFFFSLSHSQHTTSTLRTYKTYSYSWGSLPSLGVLCVLSLRSWGHRWEWGDGHCDLYFVSSWNPIYCFFASFSFSLPTCVSPPPVSCFSFRPREREREREREEEEEEEKERDPFERWRTVSSFLCVFLFYFFCSFPLKLLLFLLALFFPLHAQFIWLKESTFSSSQPPHLNKVTCDRSFLSLLCHLFFFLLLSLSYSVSLSLSVGWIIN